MKIKKSFIRIALAAGLVGLAACSGSSSSESTVRQKNSALADGSICYTDVERAGLIEVAVAREQQDAVEARPAIEAQPEVLAQAAVEAQDAVEAQVLPFDIPAVADQPEVPYQPEVFA